MPGAAAADTKLLLGCCWLSLRMWGDGRGSDSVLSWGGMASKVLPARQRGKGTFILPWENAAILHPEVLGGAGLFVMVWSGSVYPRGGGWGIWERGDVAPCLLRPTSRWATGGICKMVTSSVPGYVLDTVGSFLA